MTEQPSLFGTAEVKQWISGSWPYLVWNECGACGYDGFPSAVPPTFCPKCGAILTGGKTAEVINEELRDLYGKKETV